MYQNKEKLVLGFLIFPGFPMSCLTSAIEPLRAANEIAGTEAFAWKLISETGTRVKSSARVSFDPDLTLDEAEGLDYLILLSSPLALFENPKHANGRLRHLARHGVRMGGVSGGVFPLARSGLLASSTSSVHWCYQAVFEAEFPDIATTDNVISIDRDRYTASGAAAAFDLMLHLVEDRLGGSVTTEVACWFQHPLMRGEGVRQRTPTFQRESTADMLPSPVAEAVEIFADNITDPLDVADVADMVNVSTRQLERSFKKTTDQSPSLYYRQLRINAARQLVLYSKDSMTEIANAVGYANATPLVRYYKRAFGLSPQEDRKKINLFRVQANKPLPIG
ncbi:MAG: GlxA family transcriptional regulator [Paracoccaceae bacterium]|nr:GlxA family transcriptional regulator [Paracoccaceae bacterium]